MRKFIILPLFLILTSCASYVQNLHRQISNEERAKAMKNRPPQARYNQYGNGMRRPIENPVTLGNYPSTSTQSNYAPGVRRNYNQSVGKRRFTADDLKDNDRDGSLWTGNNSKNFLFVTNNLKREGDIVIIEVTESLKNTIQDELKRAFPDMPKRGKKGKKEEPKKEEEPKAAQAESSDPDKVYDKISTKVVEQINQQYLLLRGRKEVLFKKKKRYFEIQAIVSRKDINAKDAVESTKILEPKINVLRY